MNHPSFHSRFKLATISLLIGLTMLGCRKPATSAPETPEPSAKRHPIRVVVVDDPPLAKAITRQWAAHSEQKIQLREFSSDRLDTVKQLAADVIIYPSAWLGTLAERELIGTFPRPALRDPHFARRDVLDLQRRAEVSWGDAVYAVSFGSPQLVLFYRADLFQKLQLTPPKTWKEYQRLASRLARDKLGQAAPATDQPWTALIEPMGDGWAAKLLLARAAAYARHSSQFSTLFDYSTMDPLIGGPPFVRALEELIAANRFGPKAPESYSPQAAKRAFFAGQTAMTLAWPSHAADEQPVKVSKAIKVGFAPLPGSTQSYDFSQKTWTSHAEDAVQSVPLLAIAGRLGSVTRRARHAEEAGLLLARLAGKPWSPSVAPRSPATTLFRKSHAADPAVWTDPTLPKAASANYAEVVLQTQSQPNHLTCLRIPGWKRYLAVLDQAVRDAQSGKKSAADALSETAVQWQKLTNELGRDKQQTAYTHSLGLIR